MIVLTLCRRRKVPSTTISRRKKTMSPAITVTNSTSSARPTAKSSTKVAMEPPCLFPRLSPGSPPSPVKKPRLQKGLMGHVTQKSQQEIYARLAGEDRISFNQIARSKFINHHMNKSLELPSQAGSKTRTPVEIKIAHLYQSRYK